MQESIIKMKNASLNVLLYNKVTFRLNNYTKVYLGEITLVTGLSPVHFNFIFCIINIALYFLA